MEGLRNSQKKTSAHFEETTLNPLAVEDFRRSTLRDAMTGGIILLSHKEPRKALHPISRASASLEGEEPGQEKAEEVFISGK